MILKKYLYSPRGFFSGILFSILTVLKNFIQRKYGFEKSITINYPLDQYHYSDRFLGMPEIVLKENDKSLCISCNLCIDICPTNCLELSGLEGKEPSHFSINLSDCIYCGYCELICPEGAIVMGQKHILSAHKEESHHLSFSEWKSLSIRK
jgi:formate hydrogenlyase subunit 6/NADH:ubiquinone oxidoreductase subunit I